MTSHRTGLFFGYELLYVKVSKNELYNVQSVIKIPIYYLSLNNLRIYCLFWLIEKVEFYLPITLALRKEWSACIIIHMMMKDKTCNIYKNYPFSITKNKQICSKFRFYKNTWKTGLKTVYLLKRIAFFILEEVSTFFV